MLRQRNLDIVIATLIAILGGLAAAKNLPGQVTIPLGVGLFFAPGYLWAEALLSQQMPGFERAMAAAGMTLILPILGGFLLFALHVPLFKSDWVAMLVVLTLAGVVATAVQRLRSVPEDMQQPRQAPREQKSGGAVFLNTLVYGVAAVIGIGAIGYSVSSAENQKFPGFTHLSMTPVVNNKLAKNMALLSNNMAAQQQASLEQNGFIASAKTAHLQVTDDDNVPEQYQLKLYRKGALAQTYKISLNQGQTWQRTITYTNQSEMLAALYLAPDVAATSTPYRTTTNGVCVANLTVLPAALRSSDPCSPNPTPATTAKAAAAKK